MWGEVRGDVGRGVRLLGGSVLGCGGVGREKWGKCVGVWGEMWGEGVERCGKVCWGVREVSGDVQKLVERCWGETSFWDECGVEGMLKCGGGRWGRGMGDVGKCVGVGGGEGRYEGRCRGCGEVLGEVCDAKTI